jgi:hypothetical protein
MICVHISAIRRIPHVATVFLLLVACRDAAQQRVANNSSSVTTSASRPADSLRALQQLLTVHGKAVSASGSFLIRYSAAITEIEPCRMTLAKRDSSSVADNDDTLHVDFSLVTPNPRVTVVSDPSDSWAAILETTSGKPEIPGRRRLFFKHKVAGSIQRFDSAMVFPAADIIVQTKARAERVAELAGRVAILCGGKPMDPRFVAERNRPRDVSGNLLSDSSIVRVKAQCRELVRGNLVSPTTAQFASDSLTYARIADDKMQVDGKVAAQNRAGGILEKTFSCDFRREGDAWVPSGKPIIL